MLICVLAAIAILLLVILFRYLPHRIFFIFVGLLIVFGGIVVWMRMVEYAEPQVLTLEERSIIARDQELFTPWWGSYQKQIAELDRNWMRYHQILADAKTGEVELFVTHARLSDLERKTQELRSRIERNVPPPTLTDRLYNQLASIVSKTNDFAAGEQKAITLTRAAADPENMKEKEPAEQARLLELVMLRESPVALFVADEISAIRTYFAPISATQETEMEKPDEEREENLLDK